MKVEIFGEWLSLFPQRAIFWEKEKMLLLADMHLGKVNHFRWSGIPVPVKANDKNIEILLDLMWKTKPGRVVCLGDMFHSHYNPEWEVFGEVVKHFATASFELVLGNHDIMSEQQYIRKGIKLYDELRIGNFLFTHHPLENVPENFYNLAGHIHPGVQLNGKGKQSVTLPCFHFGNCQGLLPAFGMFTGLARIEPRKEDKVFVIVENVLMEVGSGPQSTVGSPL